MDATEIIPRMRRMVPNIIIVNPDMPAFNEREVCQAIRDNFDISLILLLEPGSTSGIELDGCLANGIVSKPVDTAHLISVVDKLFGDKKTKSIY